LSGGQNNPVKHGLVQNIRDWPHSTYHRDVRAGRFEDDFQIGDWVTPENIGDDP
jgi:putative transposase